jgi:hypothetical protein
MKRALGVSLNLEKIVVILINLSLYGLNMKEFVFKISISIVCLCCQIFQSFCIDCALKQ